MLIRTMKTHQKGSRPDCVLSALFILDLLKFLMTYIYLALQLLVIFCDVAVTACTFIDVMHAHINYR